VLKRGPDGHYRGPGLINGVPVDFLVDTGATEVALPESVARKLNLERGVAMRVHTANGDSVSYATRTRLAQVSMGGITAHDIAASIVPGMAGNEALLGMSFLGRFEVTMTGDEMRIQSY
jgi:aspartyl protease family protein